MKHHSLLLCVLLAVYCVASPFYQACGAFLVEGDVNPAEVTDWDGNTEGLIGNSADGSFIINEGSVLYSNSCYLGCGSGANGEVRVEGNGSTWFNNWHLNIGKSGSGILKIRNGGCLFSGSGSCVLGNDVNSTGIATIEGEGSTWTNNSNIYVGALGTGTLNITNGGGVTNGDYSIYVGSGPGATGSMNVNGLRSTWNSMGYFHVGANGLGTLNITNGGSVSSGKSSIGYSPGSTGIVTVEGSDSVWTVNSTLAVGDRGDGSLNVLNGAIVNSNLNSTIGWMDGSRGEVIIDGNASKWIVQSGLFIGSKGTLTISNGGAVEVHGTTYLAAASDAAGMINFGVGGGTLTTDSLRFSPSQITGEGVIHTHGLQSDMEIIYDATHDLFQVLQSNGITINYSQNAEGDLSVGYSSNGSLNILDGKQISSQNTYIGHGGGSSGIANVSGPDSTWNIRGFAFHVGSAGNGVLNITDGGTVICNNTTLLSSNFIGMSPDSTGIVHVDGLHSRLEIRHLGLGTAYSGPIGINKGTGILNISGGGEVAVSSLGIGTASLVSIDAGSHSRLTVENGTGEIFNNGNVRVLVGARPEANDVFMPITATWSRYSTGFVQAVGGTWNANTWEFTVSNVQLATSGFLSSLDLANTQRLLTSDAATGWAVGESFLAKMGSNTALDFTATAITDGRIDSLKLLIPLGQGVAGAWDFAASESGYAAGDPVYLSFDIGDGYSRSDVKVWHYDGSAWTPFAANDLTYDGRYASFTVTSFSGYAVSVPEPEMVVLLGCGLMACAAAWSKRRRRGIRL